MTLLLRQGLRHHRQKPLQSLLTLLGIAVGVALVCAMRLGQRSAERAFDRAVETVAGAATHTVDGGPAGLPASACAALLRELPGTRVAPAIQAIARVEAGGQRFVLRVLGVDPLADAALRPWSGGALVRGGDSVLGAFVTEPGAFVATGELLRRLGVQQGAALSVTIGGRPRAARCLGELALHGTAGGTSGGTSGSTAGSAIAAGLADTLVVDIATAQEWTGRLDRIDRLDLRVPSDLTPAALRAAVEHACGEGARLSVAGSRRGALQALTRSFRINLTALSFLSLLVGAFLVHETMRLSVVARRPAFGVLRALGVTGRQLGGLVVVEAVLLGALGAALGAALGVAAGSALLAPIVRTLNDHYATFALDRLDVDLGELLLAAGSGVAVAALAALAPALAASRVPAREVLVGAHAAASPERRGWPLSRALWPALASAGLLATVGPRLVQGYFGMLLLLVAAVLATPALLGGLLRLAGRALAARGPFARYVVRSTLLAKDHLALPVAAMVLAVATTIGMAVLVTSFRDGVGGWLGQVLPADIYVSVPGGVDERSQPLDSAIVAALTASDAVAACTVYHRTLLPVDALDGEEVEVVGMRPSAGWLASWPLLAGERAAAARGLSANGAWISEPLAFRTGLGVGDTIVLGRGAAALPVLAVYRDYSSERGEVLVGRDWLAQHGGAASPTALGLELAAGVDVEAACERLRALSVAAVQQTGAVPQAVVVQSTRALRDASLAVFDRTFAITGVMRLLSLLVAFFGIWSAFAGLQLERAAEIGVLRCLGARPLHIGVVVVGQTALLGLVAALLSMPLGLAIGELLARVINRVSFGWSLAAVRVPATALVEAAGLAIGAAVLAGLWPARRFARMRPAEALREA